MRLPQPSTHDTTGAEFVWPPPADPDDIFALDHEPDEGDLAAPPAPCVEAAPPLSGPGMRREARVGDQPVVRFSVGVRAWRIAGRMVLVLALVAISGSTFLGVNIAHERRHSDDDRQTIPLPARSLPARSIGARTGALPLIDVERSESFALLRLTKPSQPQRQGDSDRPTGVRPARAAEPAGVTPGWISVDVPIQLEIYEDGRFVATSASDRITLAAGEHQLELVNESLQYRSKQMVSVTPGRFTTVRVSLPSGVLHVNALPWADVTIDGTPAGQTPLGNLRLPIGPHRIVFRHPQFGERTRTALVTAVGAARVTVDYRQ